MEMKSTLDGHDLRGMFTAGTNWLEKIVPDINALNVYPVPDGDTGTNMLLTMRASVEATLRVDGSASAVARAMAQGSLRGARGNSGVILSQIWRGLAEKLEGKDIIDFNNFAQALQGAANTAYQALSHPVEGTILTVIRDAASAAQKEVLNPAANAVSVLTAAVAAARESVMNTPNLLSTLKEAGVVDAGGHGLFTFFEGALLFINGKMNGHSPELLCRQRPLVKGLAEFSHEDDFYGFCTQFMVKGRNLSVAKLRDALQDLGESTIVVGDSAVIRVHIHTHDTESVIRAATPFGEVFDIDIRDMDEQHQDYILINQGKTSMSVGVIAVVNGAGLVNAFADLGVAAIVPGGQTMNPSTMDILRTLEKVDSDNIIILPNNKNVIATALLVQSLTKKNLKVIPTQTIPQGISALVEFIPEDDFEANVKRMGANISLVKTIEVTQATRAAQVNELDVKPGQYIGLLDNELLVVSDTPGDTILKVFNIIDLTQFHLVTFYFGKETEVADAEQMRAVISERYPYLEIGVVNGGQPNYQYVISVE